jgi:hypothetical protein
MNDANARPVAKVQAVPTTDETEAASGSPVDTGNPDSYVKVKVVPPGAPKRCTEGGIKPSDRMI